MSDLALLADRFGIFVWLALLADVGVQLWKGERHWRIYAELVLGIGGLVVDGGLVFGDLIGWLSIG